MHLKKFYSTLILITLLSLHLFSLQPLSYHDIPYPAPVKYLNYKNNKVAYIDIGRGKPMLFIHGLTGNISNFKNLIGRFKKTNRVVALDLIGNGRSSKPNGMFSIDVKSNTVLFLMKKLKIKNPVIVAHSNGAVVTMNLLVKHSGIAKKVVLITPGGMKQLAPASVKFIKHYIPAWLKKFKNLDVMLKQMVYKWNRGWDKYLIIARRLALHRNYKLILRAAEQTIYSALDKAIVLPSKYKNVRIPVLIILGKHDPLVPGKYTTLNDFIDVLKNNFRNKRIILLNTGHLPQIEAPVKLFKIIKKFAG